jgi:hypothetical protein
MTKEMMYGQYRYLGSGVNEFVDLSVFVIKYTGVAEAVKGVSSENEEDRTVLHRHEQHAECANEEENFHRTRTLVIT